MTIKYNPAIHISSIVIVIVVFCLFFSFRLFVNYRTTGIDNIDNTFRVGVIPWSDAKGWFNGAVQVLDGKQISGVAARRPLYSIFLSTAFTIFGTSYRTGIIIQMSLLVLVLTGIHQLLKTDSDRFSIAAFLSLLAVWRPTITTLFLTENLGMLAIALAFAFLLLGFNNGSPSFRFTGVFLIGLSQAIRPWCFMCLATVPFISFLQNNTIKAKLRYLIAYGLIIVLGYGFHPLATTIFNKSGEASNFSKTLYGQVKGNMAGWVSIYQDPIIVESLKNGVSDQEINRIIYKRIYDLFIENPKNFFVSAIKSYKFHLKDIPAAFLDDTIGKPLFFTGFFLILLLLRRNWSFSLKPEKKYLALITIPAVVLMLNWQFSYSLTFLSAVGLSCVLFRRKKEVDVFILLFLCGIILSIPFVGSDGGRRVKLGSDILLYLLSSIGLSQILRYLLKSDVTAVCEEPSKRTGPLFLYGMISLSLLIFIAVPWMKNFANRSIPGLSELPEIGSEEIAEDLNFDSLPIGPKELNVIWHQFPKPSFEGVNGKIAYYPIRYTSLDALYFKAEEGVEIIEGHYLSSIHWPLVPLGFRRTIMVLEDRYTIFPNIEPIDLTQHEGTYIIVTGKLISKPRPFPNSTGFVLIASHIGYMDKSGKLKWMSL